MQASELQTLGSQLLWLSFFLSFVFGAIAQRTHFCTMGALSDWFNMGDAARLRQWVLALAVGLLGFAALVWWGQLDPTKTFYHSARWPWLSAVVGGLLFGFGMVLASGCGSKTLIRAACGNLKSWVVFVVMGVSAFATLRGMTAVLRDATVDKVFISMDQGASVWAWVASLLSCEPRLALVAVALGAALPLLVWVFKDRDFLTTENLLAGWGVGAVLVGMWWGSGVLGHVAEHPDTLQEVYLTTNSGRIEALTFTAPLAYVLDWFMFFSDKSKVLTWGVVSVFGVICGAAAMAVWRKEFRLEGFHNAEDTSNHLAGAVLMGVGGVTAQGCTIGQGLSGLSTLSLTSIVAIAAIVVGARAAFGWQMWRLERQVS